MQENSSAQNTSEKSITIKKCEDFSITGKGSASQWENTEWVSLQKLDPGENYDSRIKMLYSETGIYVLFYGQDKKINTDYQTDFEDLFMGDVFEVFFHTEPSHPLYFEYEINPLNKELVLLIPNFDGEFLGWIPWKYEDDRKVIKKVDIEGGDMKPFATIDHWTAEMFFPYDLFRPLQNVPPKSGTTWKANFYRMDYDSGKRIKYSWSPIEQSFHEFENFGTLHFE